MKKEKRKAREKGLEDWQMRLDAANDCNVASLLLVAMPGAPSSVLVTSSKARSP